MQLKYEEKYKDRIKEYVKKYAQRDLVVAEMGKGVNGVKASADAPAKTNGKNGNNQKVNQ